MEPTFSFRPVEAADLELLYRVYAGTRTDEMALVGMISAQLLHQQFVSSRMSLAEHVSLPRLKLVVRRTAQ